MLGLAGLVLCSLSWSEKGSLGEGTAGDMTPSSVTEGGERNIIGHQAWQLEHCREWW